MPLMPLMLRVAAVALALLVLPAAAQSLTFAEVTAAGAKPLSAAEAKELISGAKTEFTLANGSQRIWTNGADGTFTASRSNGPVNQRSGRGTWSINDDAAYCLMFDWGSMDTESWCRRLYKVEDRYYAFPLDPKPETRSGRYRFTK